MIDLKPGIFLGLIPKGPEDGDYIQGVNSPLKGQTINSTGDWVLYVPQGERQNNIFGFDTNDCTGFGYTDVIEPNFIFQIKKGLLPNSHLKFLNDNGYMDANGEPNFSDRALGSMAGTTSAGNSQKKVADTARKMGLIPESKWSWDRNKPMDFTEYYKPLPQELLDLGKRFLDFFDLPYEWCTGTADDFTHAPLYITLCTCAGWNSPPVKWCNAGNATNHAVCLLNSSKQIFDSYPPYIKQLSSDYVIPYKMKVLVNLKEPPMNPFAEPVNLNGTVGYFLKSDSEDHLKYLEGFLQAPLPLKQDLTIDWDKIRKLKDV